MVLKMDVSYVEKDITEENLREIRSDGIIITDILDSIRKVKCMVHQSSSQYRGIRSVINYVYMLARAKIP